MTGTLSLRAARLADLDAVDRLLVRSYPRLLAADYPPSVMVTAVPRLVRARPALLASGRYYVVEDGAGRVLGAGGWSAGQGPSADVRHLATDPDALRRGVGAAIMARIVGAAAADGRRWLDCLSTRGAVPFYAAQGFRVVGPVDLPLAPGIGFPVVRMVRALE